MISNKKELGSFVDSRSNEHSLANLNDNDFMDSQVTGKESWMDSVAPSNGTSERQAVSEKTSQQLVGNPSTQPYSCNICGITFSTYYQLRYHRVTKHTEERFQCPLCTRKFHIKKMFKVHMSSCADLKYSCILCGQKFRLLSTVEDHNNQVHGNRPVRNANVHGVDCTEEQTMKNVENIDVAEKMTSCIICRITFISPADLSKHKLTCPKRIKMLDDTQFSTEETSMIHANSTIVSQGENTELMLEIKVEQTTLQEQEYEVSNEDSERSSTTALRPHGGKSKDFETEDLKNGIKVKEEYLEDEEEIKSNNQNITESSECHEIPIVRNKSLVHHETDDHSFPCSICGLTFASNSSMRYHRTACHTEPRFKCSCCQKMYHFASSLRRHTKSCSELRCSKCDDKFASQPLLHYHVIHMHGEKSKDVEADDSEDLETRIKVKEEYLEDDEEILSDHQTTMESSKYHGIPIDPNESLVQAGDQFYPCPICGLRFSSKWKMRYHKTVLHTEPRHKCSHCQRMFHFLKFLRRHKKGCLELRCKKCGLKFNTYHLLRYHYITKHDGNPNDVEAGDAEEFNNGIQVKEEYPEDGEEILS